MQIYIVTLHFQFPAWDEKRGLTWEIEALSKSAAIKLARRLAQRDGHTPAVGKGRATFKAEETAR